jgi:hypothetical protein
VKASPILVLIVALGSTANVRADPLVVTDVIFSVEGVFECRHVLCSGSGTDTVTFESGDSTATLKFVGRSGTLTATNTGQTVTLADIIATATEGFTFPSHPSPFSRILIFTMTVRHAAPVVDSDQLRFEFAPGGMSVLPVLVLSDRVFRLESGVADYPLLAYGLTAKFPLFLPSNAAFTFDANFGAAPEPATMLLFSTGLAGLAYVRRRRKGAHPGAGTTSTGLQ